MKGTYIVLRDLNRARGRTYHLADEYPDSQGGLAPDFSFEEAFRGSGPQDIPENAPPHPAISSVEADQEQVEELALDMDGTAVARQMPVSMIHTLDSGESLDEDEGLSETWGIRATGADKCKFTGETATVAILDSGIRVDHQAFSAPGLKIHGKDFTGKGDIVDQSGHGTHCASIILGRDVQGRRIGVARGVRNLIVGRIFAPGVITTSKMVVEAIQWAVENGANTISMSLAFNFTGLAAELHESGMPIEAATAQALIEFQNNLRLFDNLMDMFRAQENFSGNRGVVIIGAAGNHSRRESKAGEPVFTVPVAAPNNAFGMISVGALRRSTSKLGIAPFSNSSPVLVAPGFGVVGADSRSLHNNSLVARNGTSMACPHVAGLAALWWDAIAQSRGVIKAQTVVSKLRASCRTEPLNSDLTEKDYGLGIPMAP